MFRSKRTIRIRIKKKRISAIAIAASATLMMGFAPPMAVAAPGPNAETQEAPNAKSYGDYDSRRDDPAAKKFRVDRQRELQERPAPGVLRLRRSLGWQGVLELDPLTRTPRSVAKLDGFLTGPSTASATSIVLSYLRANPDVFRLSPADLANLKLRKESVDVAGVRHLSFIQSAAGVLVFGNGLKVSVAKNGMIVNVTGSVAPGMARVTLPAAKVPADRARELSAAAVGTKPAPAAVRSRSAGTTTYANGDRTSPAAFVATDGVRRAWSTVIRTPAGTMYQHIIDAATGKVLYRSGLSANDSALVYDNYPGAPYGGNPTRTELKPTWLPKNSPRLAGNVGHVYVDRDRDNRPDPKDEIRPNAPGSFVYPLTRVKVDGSPCEEFVCTWDPANLDSWAKNRDQGGTQVMYQIGKYHDHLAAAPIGFTRENGNFEAVDGDGVNVEIFDGSGYNNANFGTPPDGSPPKMQLFLRRSPQLPSHSGDNAGTIYHEYTHGLSHRLVVDAAGNAALNSGQSGAMGEAWGDWYAMDFLSNQGYERDTTAPGEINYGFYPTGGKSIRNQPIDCPVGTTSPACPGTTGAGPGGYTYGDYGHVIGGPQVHADGEIWSQTLWQLRTAIGAKKAESVVTRAMELSPESPSFLDMRNSILQADMVVNSGRTQASIWKVFASRGMGFFASTRDGSDWTPVEDFSVPPPKGTPTGTISGTVTDAATTSPVANATIRVAGHGSGFPGDYSDASDSGGKYTIEGVPAGTYPMLTASAQGYKIQTKSGVSVPSRQIVVDWSLPGRSNPATTG